MQPDVCVVEHWSPAEESVLHRAVVQKCSNSHSDLFDFVDDPFFITRAGWDSQTSIIYSTHNIQYRHTVLFMHLLKNGLKGFSFLSSNMSYHFNQTNLL